jgi:mono/diheme cytochrome c family protein
MRTRIAGRPSIWMACAAAVFLAAAAGAGSAVPPPQMPLAIELPENPTVGARLFAGKMCARCHALGDGESRVGPDLGRIHFSGTVMDLAGTLWNHSLVMREKMRDMKVPEPTLSSREMAELIAFLTAYRYYLTEIGEPGDPARGRLVFDAKRCGRCHGAQDDWRKPAPSLFPSPRRVSAIAMAQAMWNHGGDMETEMRRAGVSWPQFAGREMADLLAYLETGGGPQERVYFEPGSPRRGGTLFTEKRCVDCHAIEGKGGRGAPDLGSLEQGLIGSLPSVAGLMWNHSHGMTAELRRRGISRVTFSGQEMADIIAYLYFVNYTRVSGAPARGAALFDARCGACHTVGQPGGGRTDLAAVAGLDDPIAIMSAMWNQSARMEEAAREQGMPWPRFAPGDAADLAAYLLTARQRLAAAPR